MKKKLLNSLRVLLVAAGLCVGASNAWAQNWGAPLVTYDFENQETFTTDWPTANGGNGQETIWGSRTLEDETTSHFFLTRDFGGKGRVTTHTISNSSFLSAAEWKIEFDFSMYVSASNANYLQLNTGSGFLFKLASPTGWSNTTGTISNSSSTAIGNFDCDEYTSSTRGTQSADGTVSVTKWHHVTVIGNSNGIYLTVDKSDGTSVLTSTKVAEFANPTTITMSAGKTFGQVGIDDVKFYKAINPVVTTQYQLSDGTTIIDDLEEEVVSGSSYSISYPEVIYAGNKQYTYKSGANNIASVTSNQTVTVVYNDEADLPSGYFFAQNFEKTGTDDGWTSGNEGRFNPVVTIANGNHYMNIGRNGDGNNGTSLSSTLFANTVAAETAFTLLFDFQITTNSDLENSHAKFQLKDKAGSQDMLNFEAIAANTWKINNDEDLSVVLSPATWYSLRYSRHGGITYLTITKTSDDSEILARTQIATLSQTGGLGNISITTSRYNMDFSMDNMIIREIADGDVPVVTATTYTIHHVDADDNEIGEDLEIATIVGQEVAATAAQMAAIYENGKKYIYTSGNETITTVADGASNVITLKYREAATWGYTVKATPTNEVIATGSNFEQETITIPYPHYSLSGTTLYKKDANSSQYKQNITLSSYNQVSEFEYSSYLSKVVYYTEGEDIEGATRNTTSTNVDIRASKAAAASIPNELTITNLPAGTYKLIVGIHHYANNANVTVHFTLGDNNIDVNKSATNVSETTTGEYSISADEDLVVTGIDGSGLLDYVIVQKTSETVDFTLGAEAGDSYKSYVTTDKTDFAATGVTAYIAKAADTTNGTVTLSTIDQAPANTPVLLKGTKGGTAEIATTTDEVAAISTNYLKAADGSTAISSSDAKYVLAYNDKWEFRHYNGTLSAGKVYLDLSELGEAAASLNFIFEDETNGISTVQSEGNTTNAYYNLSGQRVNQPTKGLYIVNGKKVIIK